MANLYLQLSNRSNLNFRKYKALKWNGSVTFVTSNALFPILVSYLGYGYHHKSRLILCQGLVSTITTIWLSPKVIHSYLGVSVKQRGKKAIMRKWMKEAGGNTVSAKSDSLLQTLLNLYQAYNIFLGFDYNSAGYCGFC